MFRNFPRRNDRKARVSSWFARERDGDMQSFDVHGPVSGARLYFAAVLRERAARRSARAAGPA